MCSLTPGLSSSTYQWGSLGRVTLTPASPVSSSVKWGWSHYLPHRTHVGKGVTRHKSCVPAGCRYSYHTERDLTGTYSHLTGFICWGFKARVFWSPLFPDTVLALAQSWSPFFHLFHFPSWLFLEKQHPPEAPHSPPGSGPGQ